MKTMRSAFSEAWEKTSQPMGPSSTRRRSTPRQSTRYIFTKDGGEYKGQTSFYKPSRAE